MGTNRSFLMTISIYSMYGCTMLHSNDGTVINRSLPFDVIGAIVVMADLIRYLFMQVRRRLRLKAAMIGWGQVLSLWTPIRSRNGRVNKATTRKKLIK